jgi:hypothetical protein
MGRLPRYKRLRLVPCRLLKRPDLSHASLRTRNWGPLAAGDGGTAWHVHPPSFWLASAAEGVQILLSG